MRNCLLLIPLILLVASCGGGDGGSPVGPTPTPAPTRAVLVVTITPSPVIALRNDTRCPTSPYASLWTTTIKETAGVSGNVNFINVTGRNPLGFELSTVNYDVNEIIRRAGTNHVNAGGEISIRMGLCHGEPRQAHVVQVVNFTDDLGNAMNVATEFDIL